MQERPEAPFQPGPAHETSPAVDAATPRAIAGIARDGELRVRGRTERRLRIVARIGLVWALLIAGRLAYLQVYKYDHYRKLADNQQVRVIEIQAPRGTIADCKGRSLAVSVPLDTVVVNPTLVPDIPMAASILSSVLALDEAKLRAEIENARGDPGRSGFLRVKRRISPEESERLKNMRLDWIEFTRESKRVYPNRRLASHLLGSVDDGEQGNFGLELGMNDELSGVAGAERVVRDVRRRRVESRVTSEPQPGDRVTLTIDQNIQYAAEAALREAAEAERCPTGSVIVLRAGTNEVLAMANYPDFDPNQPATRQELSRRVNLAISSPVEPGSVFKLVTVSSAIDAGRVTPGTLINCGNGSLNMYGRVVHEARTRGYGVLPVSEVLAKSSNIGAIQIGMKLGVRTFYDYIRRFGIGSKTDLPLPYESGGRIRRAERWEATSIGSVSMGHEVSVTTVQLALACSVLTNGGAYLKPVLIKRQERPGKGLVAWPAPASRQVIKPETAIAMRRMAEEVVLHGTGTGARLKGYTSGGKTGSAQIFDYATGKYTHKYNASFAGFAPVTNPTIVVAVTLNGSSKFGGVVAAPVFKRVAEAALRALEVPRDIPEQLADSGKSAAGEDDKDDLALAELSRPALDLIETATGEDAGAGQLVAPRAPDFHGKSKRSVAEESRAVGVEVDLLGEGVARAQFPPAGAALAPGARVKVRFAR
jgi:cell division protein FtsI (penicillin-binding protein 3)